MTDRFNTIAGWVLFAGIVALGLSIISGMVFRADNPHRPEQMGFVIEGVEEEGGGDSGPALGELLAAGSIDAGEASFAKCISCHTIEQGGADGIGPNLYGVLGTAVGAHAAGFAYSTALPAVGGTWTYEQMDEWLRSPRAFAPGTKMSFAGLSNPEERANIILYMHSYGGGPAFPAVEASAEEEPLAEGEEAPAEGTAADAGAVAAEQPVDGADQTAAVE